MFLSPPFSIETIISLILDLAYSSKYHTWYTVPFRDVSRREERREERYRRLEPEQPVDADRMPASSHETPIELEVEPDLA
jgi:hypothetical protein